MSSECTCVVLSGGRVSFLYVVLLCVILLCLNILDSACVLLPASTKYDIYLTTLLLLVLLLLLSVVLLLLCNVLVRVEISLNTLFRYFSSAGSGALVTAEVMVDWSSSCNQMCESDALILPIMS